MERSEYEACKKEEKSYYTLTLWENCPILYMANSLVPEIQKL